MDSQQDKTYIFAAQLQAAIQSMDEIYSTIRSHATDLDDDIQSSIEHLSTALSTALLRAEALYSKLPTDVEQTIPSAYNPELISPKKYISFVAGKHRVRIPTKAGKFITRTENTLFAAKQIRDHLLRQEWDTNPSVLTMKSIQTEDSPPPKTQSAFTEPSLADIEGFPSINDI